MLAFVISALQAALPWLAMFLSRRLPRPKGLAIASIADALAGLLACISSWLISGGQQASLIAPIAVCIVVEVVLLASSRIDRRPSTPPGLS